jgi:hypothetical protein
MIAEIKSPVIRNATIPTIAANDRITAVDEVGKGDVDMLGPLSNVGKNTGWARVGTLVMDCCWAASLPSIVFVKRWWAARLSSSCRFVLVPVAIPFAPFHRSSCSRCRSSLLMERTPL